ncbi:MAG: hypothetical protein WCF18_23760 [Chthoniobacteraceae bacterium]
MRSISTPSPSPEANPLPGEIITFYAYKGGTGRTMAVANVGCLLAENRPGQPVLMVDWDLEAPGLHLYFTEQHIDYPDVPPWWSRPREERPGLVDFMVEAERRARHLQSQSPLYKDYQANVAALGSAAISDGESAVKAELESAERGYQDAEQAYLSADIGVQISARILDELAPENLAWRVRLPGENADEAHLYLLPAGSFGPDYEKAATGFNWEGFHRDFPLFFQMLAERLAAHFRYVLVDSRTGVTDSSRICTAILPEKLVVVFTPNRQSLDGIRDWVRKAVFHRENTPDDIRPLTVFPLPSRIEADRPQLLKTWRFGDKELGIEGYEPIFRGLMGEIYSPDASDLGEYFDEVKIQQIRDYAYGERIAVLEEREEKADRFSLTRSYQSFTERLVNSSAPWVRHDADGQVIAPIKGPRRNFAWLLKEWLVEYFQRMAVSGLLVALGLCFTLWRNSEREMLEQRSRLNKAELSIARNLDALETQNKSLVNDLSVIKNELVLEKTARETSEKHLKEAAPQIAEANTLKRTLEDTQGKLKDAEQELQRLAEIRIAPAPGPEGKTGYIWLGTWDENRWSLVNLATPGSRVVISARPEEILPGAKFDARSYLNLREGLPESSASYYRGLKVLGVVPEGATVEILEAPQSVARLDRIQIWAKVKLVVKK